jgi:hypothetical protein
MRLRKFNGFQNDVLRQLALQDDPLIWAVDEQALQIDLQGLSLKS